MMPVHQNKTSGLGVTHETWESAKNAIRQHIASRIPVQVITLTPEMCVRSWTDPSFQKIVQDAQIVVADGIGVVWGHGLLSGKKPEKIPGIELAKWSLEEVNRVAGRVFLLGAKPEVIPKAAEWISKTHPRLNVTGFHHGYFTPDEESAIVEKIAAGTPDLLLVGLGSPAQERFIHRNLDALNCGAAIGIGGSFDVWAGIVKRAPGLFRTTGTEWLYRIATQPGLRMKRIPQLVRFIFLCLKAKQQKMHLDEK